MYKSLCDWLVLTSKSMSISQRRPCVLSHKRTLFDTHRVGWDSNAFVLRELGLYWVDDIWCFFWDLFTVLSEFRGFEHVTNMAIRCAAFCGIHHYQCRRIWFKKQKYRYSFKLSSMYFPGRFSLKRVSWVYLACLHHWASNRRYNTCLKSQICAVRWKQPCSVILYWPWQSAKSFGFQLCARCKNQPFTTSLPSTGPLAWDPDHSSLHAHSFGI